MFTNSEIATFWFVIHISSILVMFNSHVFNRQDWQSYAIAAACHWGNEIVRRIFMFINLSFHIIHIHIFSFRFAK